jgi:hypothetical protein
MLATLLLLVTSVTGTLALTADSASAVGVSSSYLHSSEYGPLHNAARELGMSDAQFQKTAVSALGFIFGIGGVTNFPMAAPGPGDHSISSNYTTSDLQVLDRVRTITHLSRAGAQKVSALFIAYLVAIS